MTAMKIETFCVRCFERSSRPNVIRNALRYQLRYHPLEDVLSLEGDTFVIGDLCTFCQGVSRDRPKPDPADPDEPPPF
jgi:hypothetical protein